MSELAQEIQAIVEAEQPKPQEVATETATPEVTDQPAVADESKEEAVAPKTFTEAELKAQLDAEAAKIRNKYERKLEKQRIQTETRAQVLAEVQKPATETVKPVPDDFTDYADYLEALADYKAEEKFAALTQRQKDAERTAKQQTEIERQSERKQDMIQAGETKYPDFEDALLSSKTRIADEAYLAILETDNSADIAYFLATHDDEAQRIAALPPYAQAKEIGKLEDKLAAKTPIKKSDAPKPITPVNGSKDFTKRYEDMTIAEIEADAIKRGARWT